MYTHSRKQKIIKSIRNKKKEKLMKKEAKNEK